MPFVDLASLVAAQDHLLHRRHALDAGMTARALAYRTRPGGPWRVVLPQVVAAFSGRLTDEQRWRAALLYVENGADHATGQFAMLGAWTALAACGLTTAPIDRHSEVAVLLSHDRRRLSVTSTAGFAVSVKRSTRLPAPWWRAGLPVAPVPRAVVDTCRALRSLRDVRAVIAEAVQTRRTTVDRIGHEVLVGESAGTRHVRRALEEVGWGARSAPEAEVARDLRRSALPPARWNPSLLSVDGVWLADPDAWWREANTVLEIDSYRWHLSPQHADDTMRRHDAATRAPDSTRPSRRSRLPRRVSPEPARFRAAARRDARGRPRHAGGARRRRGRVLRSSGHRLVIEGAADTPGSRWRALDQGLCVT